MILTENKSARATALEIGTIILNEFPRVILTLLIVKSSLGVYQRNDVVLSITISTHIGIIVQ